MASHTILDEIIGWKLGEVGRLKRAHPIDRVWDGVDAAPPPRDFGAALRGGPIRLIAEVKRASPSKGLLKPDLDAVALARAYEANGAAAVSVLTDHRFFQGSLDDLTAIRVQVQLPVLRKDFVIDPYQVYEARAAGADAVLLIVAALSDRDLASLFELVCDLSMAALVEVHNAAELQRALQIRPRIVGINNRNLHTFEVDLGTSVGLRSQVPPDIVVVAESGVHTRADVERLAGAGIDAVLVGESLVRATDAGRQVRELVQ